VREDRTEGVPDADRESLHDRFISAMQRDDAEMDWSAVAARRIDDAGLKERAKDIVPLRLRSGSKSSAALV